MIAIDSRMTILQFFLSQGMNMNLQASLFIAAAIAIAAYQWVKHKGTKKIGRKVVSFLQAYYWQYLYFLFPLLQFLVFGGRKVKQKKMLNWQHVNRKKIKTRLATQKITIILFMNVNGLSRNQLSMILNGRIRLPTLLL